MKKILLFLILAGVLLLPSFAFAAMRDITDYTFRPVQADLVTTLPQYSSTVTASATDTEVALYTMNYLPYETGKIRWAYLDLDAYIKADTSATADIIWRVEARNAGRQVSSVWDIVNHDFVITSSNDVLNLTTANGTANIDTPDGTYTGTTLAAAMQVVVRADGTLDLTAATVAYSDTTHKFTVSDPTLAISMAFSSSDMATTVGFDRDLTAATEQTSRFAVPAYYEANIGTTWVQKRYKGYLRLDDTYFDLVPFDLRVVFQCNEGAEAKGRISSNTQLRAIYKDIIE